MSIIDHFEKHLGKIDQGWEEPNANSRIRVVSFEDKPFEGAITYASIGLSECVLSMVEDKKIRQELIFSTYCKYDHEQVASFLTTLAEYVSIRGSALLRGDVIGPSTSIIFGTGLNSVYSAIPNIFEDSFMVYEETIPKTVLVWMIPIHEEEANYVRASGWSNFETILEQKDPDLWDIARYSVI